EVGVQAVQLRVLVRHLLIDCRQFLVGGLELLLRSLQLLIDALQFLVGRLCLLTLGLHFFGGGLSLLVFGLHLLAGRLLLPLKRTEVIARLEEFALQSGNAARSRFLSSTSQALDEVRRRLPANRPSGLILEQNQ